MIQSAHAHESQSMTRRGAEMAIAFLFAAAIIVVGGGAVFFVLTISPAFTNPAAVPSTAAAVEPGRYSGAVDESRRLARALVVEENLPGLSLAVAADGELVWAEGFGWADVERRAPVTPLTRFRLGSVSKTLTAAAVAVLHDRVRIDLDAPVQRYVPAYPEKQWTLTTRQLMGDIAGVHVIRGDNNDSMPARDCASLDEALQIVAVEPLLFEPGTKYRFPTNGWILLSAVVEAAAREPFPTFMTREVFTPLGMESTVIEADEKLPDTTSFYFPRANLDPKLGVEEASAAQLVSVRRRRVSLDVIGPGSVRVGDAEARTVEGGHHRASPDAAPARLGRVHELRAGLEGGARSTERRVLADGGAPRHSHGRHRRTSDVPGSPPGDRRCIQRVECRGRRAVWCEGRGGVRETSAGAASEVI